MKYSYDENVLLEMKSMYENGSNKNEVCSYLMKEEIEFSKIQSYINELKKVHDISFKRESNNWNFLIEFFSNEFDLKLSDEKNKENLLNFLNEKENDEKKWKKYISSYYNYSKEIYKIGFE